MREFSYYASRLNQYVHRILHAGILRRDEKQTEILCDLYHTVNNFLRKLDVLYSITYGALLGWHRDYGLIPGDRDVDFALLEGDYEKIWRCHTALPKEYRMHDTSRYHRGPKLFVSYKGFDADLYFSRVTGDSMQAMEITAPRQYMKSFPTDFIFSSKSADFPADATFVPDRALDFFVHTYGYLDRNGVRDKLAGLWSEPVPVSQGNP